MTSGKASSASLGRVPGERRGCGLRCWRASSFRLLPGPEPGVVEFLVLEPDGRRVIDGSPVEDVVRHDTRPVAFGRDPVDDEEVTGLDVEAGLFRDFAAVRGRAVHGIAVSYLCLILQACLRVLRRLLQREVMPSDLYVHRAADAYLGGDDETAAGPAAGAMGAFAASSLTRSTVSSTAG